MWKRPKPTRKPRKDTNKSSENTPVQSDNPVSNSPTSGLNPPPPVVATSSGIVGTITPPEESGTQLHELEQYISAYGRVVSTKYIPGTKVFPITPLTTQRLGTRSMNNQVHKVLRENHKGRWSPRIDNSEDTTPKNVSTPSDRGTPAKLLVEWEKLPARGPYVPHEDLRGVRFPQWFLNYELRTPADVLFLHRLVVAYQMPQKGDPEWYGFKETSLDIVKALTGNF
ncbi:hypothetical protein GY45DRAFT_1376327 [Cubamyces sp. BRFM 1775]|nr:hypothetical protein GY45DRAFT_1376327 [Cubamyces sp. BRFM 1775]